MLQQEFIEDSHFFETLIDIYQHAVETWPDRTVFRIKRQGSYVETSYSDFDRQVRAVAAWLRENGCNKRRKVGIISENRPEWGIVYFGILLTGATVVPIDANLGESEVEHIINDSGLSILFCSSGQYDKIGEIHSLLKGLKKTVIFDRVSLTEGDMIELDTVIREGSAASKPLETGKIKPDDVAALIYTSGTTGSSKGVMLTHRNIAFDVTSLRHMIYFNENDVFLSVLPLHHTFECTTGLIIPISKGCSVTYAESLASKRIMANIRETGVTIMMGVPLLYEKMVTGLNRAISEKPGVVRLMFKSMMGMVRGVKRVTGRNLGKKVFRSLREKAGLGTLRIMISGGAPLQPWIGQTFEYLGINFLNGYGLTETSPVLCVNVEVDIDNNTVGYPLWGLELAIDQPNEQGIGELKVKGPVVMQGYYKNKKATKEILRDGWLYTGDLARFDEKGRVIISGRSKNLIVTAGGKNVYPEEIEMKLNDSPYILESLVLGRPLSESNYGEEVVAWVVPDYEVIDADEGTDSTGQDIESLICKEISAINQQLIGYKRIKETYIREEEFPKTSTRKIKRYLFQNTGIQGGK